MIGTDLDHRITVFFHYFNSSNLIETNEMTKYLIFMSVSGVAVIIVAFQAADPGSTPG